jgi:hypothetical protein
MQQSRNAQLFLQHCIDLAWPFFNTMAFVYQNNLINCDLFHYNVLFHMYGDKVFVRVSDWRLALNITFPTYSIYEENKQHAARKMKAKTNLGGFNVIFVKGDPNVLKQSLETNSFAIGKLALLIMDEPNDEHFIIREKQHFSFFWANMSNLFCNKKSILSNSLSKLTLAQTQNPIQ